MVGAILTLQYRSGLVIEERDDVGSRRYEPKPAGVGACLGDTHLMAANGLERTLRSYIHSQEAAQIFQ